MVKRSNFFEIDSAFHKVKSICDFVHYVNLPDGRLQTVNYHADEAGYVADVQYTGNAVVPAYAPAPVPAYGPQ